MELLGTTPTMQSTNYNALANEPSTPIRTGYTFTDWNTKGDGSGTTWDFSTTRMPASDTVLYAQWTINSYNLSFDLNGASGTTPQTQTMKYDTLAKSVAQPKRVNYTFKGWNTSKDGSGQTWQFNQSKMPAKNLTLYAQWNKTKSDVLNDIPKGGSSLELIYISIILGGSLFVFTRIRQI